MIILGDFNLLDIRRFSLVHLFPKFSMALFLIQASHNLWTVPHINILDIVLTKYAQYYGKSTMSYTTILLCHLILHILVAFKTNQCSYSVGMWLQMKVSSLWLSAELWPQHAFSPITLSMSGNWSSWLFMKQWIHTYVHVYSKKQNQDSQEPNMD